MGEFELKMTPKEFMRKVIELYRLSRIPEYYHPQVRRGRSHAVAGRAEDLVAAFLGFNLSQQYEIRVDQPISMIGTRKAIYLDIALLQGSELKQILDVKMDLGWNRAGLPEFCEEKRKMIRQIRGSQVRLKDGITKKLEEIYVSSNCSYHILIISDQNISDAQLKASLTGVEEYEPDVTTYVLSGSVHPNEYGVSEDKLLGQLDIHKDAFERLLVKLTQSPTRLDSFG